MSATKKDIGVSSEGAVGIVEIQRPPHNFFDNALINQIADAFEAFDKDNNIRAYVLCAQGKSFCAGADFANRPQTGAAESGKHLYKEATRLFRAKKPSVGAIHGPAIGGGLGLALMPDFRVTCTEGRFAANFTRLGFHPGFSLTYTLPRLIGQQKANLMFYTGRRIGGEEAVAWGMADLLVPLADVRKAAIGLAAEIAESAPLAVMSTRETMRRGFADGAEAATERELTEQDWTRKTEDFKARSRSSPAAPPASARLAPRPWRAKARRSSSPTSTMRSARMSSRASARRAAKPITCTTTCVTRRHGPAWSPRPRNASAASTSWWPMPASVSWRRLPT